MEMTSVQTIDEALEKLKIQISGQVFIFPKRIRNILPKKGLIPSAPRRRLCCGAACPAEIPNDGKQTPMRGHPVFIAQHACACCCRGCLNKWYRVPKGKQLSAADQQKIVNLLMAWIEREVKMG